MVLAHVAVGQHIVAELLAVAQAGAVAQHDPGVRAQHGDVVGDGLGVGRADADVDHGDAGAVGAHQVVGRHLRQSGWWGVAPTVPLAEPVIRLGRQPHPARHHIARLHERDVLAVPGRPWQRGPAR
jgi:hypothetical protein